MAAVESEPVFPGPPWRRPPTEQATRATVMASFYEARRVRSETTTKACAGVPAPAGRLYGTGGRCSLQQYAVAFRFHGRVLGQLGGFGTELEGRPNNS